MRAGVTALVIAGSLHVAVAVAVYANYKPLRPIFECVESSPDGSFVAHFGFWNRTRDRVDRPVGDENSFNGDVADRGQPRLFPRGRSRPYPKAHFRVVSGGEPLLWQLDGHFAVAMWGARPCSVEPEPLERPEPKLQKIKPVVDEKPDAKEEPKKTEEAPKKPEVKAERTRKPKVRRKKKRKRKPVVAEVVPLIVSNAGEFGTIGVIGGDIDQFGSGGLGASTPAAEVSDDLDAADGGSGVADEAPNKTVGPKILAQGKVTGKYPPEASGLGRYVKVEMSLLVGTNGRVRKVRVIRSGGKLFDREARRVGHALKFRPGTTDGVPREMWVPWILEFLPPR